MKDRAITMWVTLLLLGVYLLSFSGLFYSQDSMLMFSVAESFVKRGEFNADQMWTIYKTRNELGVDGEAYSKTGYGAPLFATPLYALALYLPGNLGLGQTTLLASSLAIALAAWLVFLSARRLKFTQLISALTALLFGLATPAWVYAKQFWSEPFALLTLIAAFYFLQCFRTAPNNRDALIAGTMLGLAIATRMTNAVLVPLFAWYGFGDLFHAALKRRMLAPLLPLGLFVGALGVFALSIGWYNWARYGNPLNSGYRADETFDNPIGLGMYGLLMSPGKGLFVYAPFLLALPFTVIAFFRRAKPETVFIGGVSAFYILLFSAWYYWWGGTNWGPRFLVPILPFVVLLVAPAIEFAQSTKPRARAIIFGVLCFAGTVIQLIGISVPALAYRARMLKLSPHPDMDAIFTPQFSPIIGSLNLLRPSVLDFAWLRVVDGETQIDWLVIGLMLAFIVFCACALMAGVGRRLLVIGAMVCVIALAGFSLARYRDDARWGGGDGWRALVATLAHEEQPGDVMILNDDTRAQFFLNENRAHMRWYGLSRNPAQWDDATRGLLERLSRQFKRVWFVYDDVTTSLPDPTGDWLDQSLREISVRDFKDGVHAILYATRGF